MANEDAEYRKKKTKVIHFYGSDDLLTMFKAALTAKASIEITPYNVELSGPLGEDDFYALRACTPETQLTCLTHLLIDYLWEVSKEG